MDGFRQILCSCSVACALLLTVAIPARLLANSSEGAKPDPSLSCWGQLNALRTYLLGDDSGFQVDRILEQTKSKSPDEQILILTKYLAPEIFPDIDAFDGVVDVYAKLLMSSELSPEVFSMGWDGLLQEMFRNPSRPRSRANGRADAELSALYGVLKSMIKDDQMRIDAGERPLIVGQDLDELLASLDGVWLSPKTKMDERWLVRSIFSQTGILKRAWIESADYMAEPLDSFASTGSSIPSQFIALIKLLDQELKKVFAEGRVIKSDTLQNNLDTTDHFLNHEMMKLAYHIDRDEADLRAEIQEIEMKLSRLSHDFDPNIEDPDDDELEAHLPWSFRLLQGESRLWARLNNINEFLEDELFSGILPLSELENDQLKEDIFLFEARLDALRKNSRDFRQVLDTLTSISKNLLLLSEPMEVRLESYRPSYELALLVFGKSQAQKARLKTLFEGGLYGEDEALALQEAEAQLGDLQENLEADFDEASDMHSKYLIAKILDRIQKDWKDFIHELESDAIESGVEVSDEVEQAFHDVLEQTRRSHSFGLELATRFARDRRQFQRFWKLQTRLHSLGLDWNALPHDQQIVVQGKQSIRALVAAMDPLFEIDFESMDGSFYETRLRPRQVDDTVDALKAFEAHFALLRVAEDKARAVFEDPQSAEQDRFLAVKVLKNFHDYRLSRESELQSLAPQAESLRLTDSLESIRKASFLQRKSYLRVVLIGDVDNLQELKERRALLSTHLSRANRPYEVSAGIISQVWLIEPQDLYGYETTLMSVFSSTESE